MVHGSVKHMDAVLELLLGMLELLEDRDDSEVKTEPVLGLRKMLVPIIAGILSALRRVIARRVSIKVVTFM